MQLPIPNETPIATPAVLRLMPKPPSVLRHRAWWIGALVAGLVVVVGTAIDLGRRPASPEPPVLLLAPVTRGLVIGSVRASGYLEPLAPGDATRLQLVVAVPESELARVRTGQAARFTVPAYPGRFHVGRVTKLLGLQDRNGVRVLPVVLSVENDDGRLLPGMSASVAIATSSDPGVFRVPRAALEFAPKPGRSQLDDPAIWIADGPQHSFTRVPVEVGVVDESFAEIRTRAGGVLREGAAVVSGYANVK
jgi:HlyD family secretion protein